ncbi:MAG: hypothetical protein ACD_12C00287G0001, partial [uncultured bacterium]
IIRKIKNGQIDNYSYIVKKYTTLIYRFIQRKLFNKEDVDDLVQNVFISFYKAIEKFDEKKPIKPYLFQIVQNELKMHYRLKKPTTSLNDNTYLIDDRSQDNNIDDYLSHLNQEERNIFQHISKGYSYEDIGKLFKKPVNTIKSIVRRGRLKLKSIYEKT